MLDRLAKIGRSAAGGEACGLDAAACSAMMLCTSSELVIGLAARVARRSLRTASCAAMADGSSSSPGTSSEAVLAWRPEARCLCRIDLGRALVLGGGGGGPSARFGGALTDGAQSLRALCWLGAVCAAVASDIRVMLLLLL